MRETFDDWDVHLSTYLSGYHERTALATWNLMVRRGNVWWWNFALTTYGTWGWYLAFTTYLMMIFGIGHMEPDWSLVAYLGLTWIRHISLADPTACPCHAMPSWWPICIPAFMSSWLQQCITAHCTGVSSFHIWENQQLLKWLMPVSSMHCNFYLKPGQNPQTYRCDRRCVKAHFTF